MTCSRPYLNQKGLDGLRGYKYRGSDSSQLYAHVFKPLAVFAVERLTPLWLAPNLITFAGFLLSVLNLLVVSYYAPLLTEELPSWVPIMCGINLFLYQTLDNMDGQQARRTGTSSPLGQLFDHGCDALNTVISTVTVAACLRLGSDWTLTLCVTTMATFYFATWAEYVTGELVLGSFNGPDEGLLMTYTMCIVTGIFGSRFWLIGFELPFGFLTTIVELVGGPLPTPGVLQVNHCVVLLTILASIIVTTVDMNRSVAVAPQKFQVVRLLAPFFCTALLSILWSKDNSFMSEDPDAINYMLFLTVGFIFARVVCWLILCHVCKMTYQLRDLKFVFVLLIPLINHIPRWFCVMGLLSEPTCEVNRLAFDEILVAQVTMSIAAGIFFHYAIFVTREITAALGISTFTIPSVGTVQV